MECKPKQPAPLASAAGSKQSKWVDQGVSTSLCWLCIDGDKDETTQNRCSLPPSLYGCAVAPFLRFDGPQPNQLYAVGGRSQQQNPLDTVEMFDTWHGQWRTCPSMVSCRAGCAAATLPDGRLFVVGGYDERGIVEGLLPTCEVFDPTLQRWRPEKHELARARWGHGCATLQGLVYAVGGCSLGRGAPVHESFMETLRACEVYDPSSGIWTPCADLNVARAGARVVSLSDRYLAAVGGCEDVFGSAVLLPTVELFEGHAGRWSILDVPLSTPRTTAAVAALDSHQIVIMGGAPSLSSTEVYSVPEEGPEHNRSQQETLPEDEVPPCALEERRPSRKRPSIGDMIEGRMGCQAVAMELPAPGKQFPLCSRQCVVVVGGENEDSSGQISSVLVYDVEGNSWRSEGSFPPLPTPRTAMALAVGRGVVSGHD